MNTPRSIPMWPWALIIIVWLLWNLKYVQEKKKLELFMDREVLPCSVVRFEVCVNEIAEKQKYSYNKPWPIATSN